tara:strand:+ start:969 stop:1238 length:270 start_codon:yes stop_codon:yes gene_type:complete
MTDTSLVTPVATTTLQLGDVVQINSDANNPTETIGCLGYVMDNTNSAAIIIRVYQPKTVGENAEFSEYTLPNIALTFVGTVPADMQPIA